MSDISYGSASYGGDEGRATAAYDDALQSLERPTVISMGHRTADTVDVESPSLRMNAAGVGSAVSPVAVLPAFRSPAIEYGFSALQRWEGVVQSLSDSGDTFWAELHDLDKAPSDGRLMVELYVEDVSQDDAPLLRVGAVFYWTIGYRSALRDGRGTRTRASQLRFRRRPVPKAPDERQIQARVDAIKNLFSDADDDFANS